MLYVVTGFLFLRSVMVSAGRATAGERRALRLMLRKAEQVGERRNEDFSNADTEQTKMPVPSVDITRLAQWTVSNPVIATVSASGFVTVLGHGELNITATYANYSPQVWSILADPEQPPQNIYFLSGVIRENDGTDTRIPDAVVEILDGYNAGKSATSNQFGAYNIARVLTKMTCTVRASKPGYLPSTTTYEVGGPVQLPGETNNRPFLDFPSKPRSAVTLPSMRRNDAAQSPAFSFLFFFSSKTIVWRSFPLIAF